MMNKTFTTLILCCFVTFASCNQEENKLYVDYFTEINRVENLISAGDYARALQAYDSLFAEYKNHHYRDLHNATICAIKAEDWGKAYQLSEELVLHGYELEHFEGPGLCDLKNNAGQWECFEAAYPKLRKKYEAGLDMPFREQLTALYQEDQAAASHHDIALQDSVFYDLSIRLSDLIETNYFPAITINKDSIGQNAVFVMLRHYHGLYNRAQMAKENGNESPYADREFRIRDLTDTAFRKGLMRPDIYVDITTYWDASNPYGEPMIDLDYEKESVSLIMYNMTEEKREEANSRRAAIGLPELGTLTEGFIEGTWWRHYSFKEIKEAWMNCDTCETGLDYVKISGAIQQKVMIEYYQDIPATGFILYDYGSINKTYARNSHLYGYK